MNIKKSKIAFIGCGNMGRSLIGGLLANGHPGDRLCGADSDPAQREICKKLFDLEILENNSTAVQNADVVVLAIKPQGMKSTVTEIADDLRQRRPLIISIAAGIRLAAISKWLQAELPLVRAMPNTPALIQAGAAALFAGSAVSAEQRELAEGILRSVGLAVWLDDEALMDTVTALSGSGPAYFFLLMEILEKAAVKLGLEQEQARILTLETAFGATKMAMESGLDAATLRKQVTSPGGTTEQALNILNKGNIEQLFNDALTAAQHRSIELADSFGEER